MTVLTVHVDLILLRAPSKHFTAHSTTNYYPDEQSPGTWSLKILLLRNVAKMDIGNTVTYWPIIAPTGISLLNKIMLAVAFF